MKIMADLHDFTQKNTGSIDDYIAKMTKNPEFREAMAAEYGKLASAAALIEAREEAGLSQEGLAVKANVPQSTIARIESGQNTSIATLTKIGAALGKHMIIKYA
jgi:ribosome-binding protein aMBF1 (putative translation factor)